MEMISHSYSLFAKETQPSRHSRDHIKSSKFIRSRHSRDHIKSLKFINHLHLESLVFWFVAKADTILQQLINLFCGITDHPRWHNQDTIVKIFTSAIIGL